MKRRNMKNAALLLRESSESSSQISNWRLTIQKKRMQAGKKKAKRGVKYF
ncbi:MAG: hypothetical protein ACQERB_04440 [Promethearchaeati archaeon]